MKRPWFKFYPADWRADPLLGSCSISARGLWMEMLCIMHEATPRGSLLIQGRQLSNPQWASLFRVPLDEMLKYMQELEDAGVFSRRSDGAIYSRRMERDQEKTERDKANGSTGGNPGLTRRRAPTLVG